MIRTKMKVTYRDFAGLRVALTGGTDGSGGGKGPLVVLLHGFGAPGGDLVPLAEFFAAPPGTRFAFPAAPLSLAGQIDFGQGDFGPIDSRAWWMLDMQRLQVQMMAVQTGNLDLAIADVPVGMAAARQQLLLALDELVQALEVPPGQLLLGGFSQGAMLSLDVALRSDRQLAGLVLLSGTLLAAQEWLPLMPARRAMPVLQSHGQADMLLPFSLAERLRNALAQAGVAVEFVPFSGGHEIPPLVLRAVGQFLMRVLGQ